MYLGNDAARAVGRQGLINWEQPSHIRAAWSVRQNTQAPAALRRKMT